MAEVSGLIAQNRILLLKFLERYIEASKHDYFKVKDISREIQRERDALPKVYAFVQQFLWVETVLKSRALMVAKYRMARSAIAVELYKLKYNKLPKALSNLVPEFLDSVSIDPFDGKPLRYKICEVVKKQAVKMTKPERATHIVKKKSSSEFGEIFGGKSKKVRF